MICFVALFVFAVLGVFSASHRRLAKEAFNCVFRRLTLRKCDTSFDQRIKVRMSGRLLKKSPALGGFVFKHFEALSWSMTVLLVASFAYSAYSLYNLAVYGTCSPENPELCLIGGVPQETMLEAGVLKEECSCEFSLEGCSVEDFNTCGTDCKCLEKTCNGRGVKVGH